MTREEMEQRADALNVLIDQAKEEAEAWFRVYDLYLWLGGNYYSQSDVDIAWEHHKERSGTVERLDKELLDLLTKLDD